MRTAVAYQRIESVTIFLAVFYFYLHLRFNIVLFFVFLLVIDLFMVGYLISNKIGAHIYNAGHNYVNPAFLIVLGNIIPSRPILALGLIWLAHIAFDRALGYGLKLETGFQDTHLGKIGKKNKR